MNLRKFIRNILFESAHGKKVYLSQDGFDGWGYNMGIHLNSDGEKIGNIVYRPKTYLKKEDIRPC